MKKRTKKIKITMAKKKNKERKGYRRKKKERDAKNNMSKSLWQI